MITPEPETSVHRPVPLNGVLPFKVAVVAQTVWLEPAFAVVGAGFTNISTVSRVGVQPNPDIVQINLFKPRPIPVMVVLANDGLVIVPEPESNDQLPVPLVGVLAAIVAVTGHIV